MTAAEIIKYAAQAYSVYLGFQRLAKVRGMDPAEFDAQVATEAKRLDGFVTGVQSAVDAEFDKG